MSGDEAETVQCCVSILQQISIEDNTETTTWTFYIRSDTHEHDFPFDECSLDKQSMTNLIIECVDAAAPGYNWALWKRKLCRNYRRSRGYWKILSSLQANPRVPLDHLNCILSLLRHETMAFDQSHDFTFTFLKQKHDFNDSVFREEDIECEYELTFWNGVKIGNVSFALRIYKAKYALISKKAKFATRDSHFMHYRSDIEWMWYDYDAHHYQKYVSGYGVLEQLEASYQGVSEDMFPIQQFHRPHKTDNTKERMFNYAQLPTMTIMAVQEKILNDFAFGCLRRPFVVRFTFGKDPKMIINIEELSINNIYEHFPTNIWRISLAEQQSVRDTVYGFVRLSFDGFVPKEMVQIILNCCGNYIEFKSVSDESISNVTTNQKDDSVEASKALQTTNEEDGLVEANREFQSRFPDLDYAKIRRIWNKYNSMTRR